MTTCPECGHDIKLCPFCGGDPYVADCGYKDMQATIPGHQVRCQDCHASGESFVESDIYPETDTRKPAINAWNRRAGGYLGVQNDWKKTPEIVERCRELNHNTGRVRLASHGDCYHMIACCDCGYWYEYDSSG